MTRIAHLSDPHFGTEWPGLPDALALLNRLQAASGGQVEAFEYMPAIYILRLSEARPDVLAAVRAQGGLSKADELWLARHSPDKL